MVEVVLVMTIISYFCGCFLAIALIVWLIAKRDKVKKEIALLDIEIRVKNKQLFDSENTSGAKIDELIKVLKNDKSDNS